MNSTNKRKFRLWDNKILFQGYEQTTQILAKLDEQISDDVFPEDLPMSLLPTNILYDLASCYVAMYEKLLTEELLDLGYPKSTNTQH